MLDVLQHEAKHNSERVFAVLCCGNTVSEELQEITFGQIGNAVTHLVERLQTQWKNSPRAPWETLAYIGCTDLRYNIFFYAAVACGFKVSQA